MRNILPFRSPLQERVEADVHALERAVDVLRRFAQTGPERCRVDLAESLLELARRRSMRPPKG